MNRLRHLESELESLEKLGNQDVRVSTIRNEIRTLLELVEQSKRLIEEYRSRIIRLDGSEVVAPLLNAKLRGWIQEEKQRLKELSGEEY